jgi:hypothetical protein
MKTRPIISTTKAVNNKTIYKNKENWQNKSLEGTAERLFDYFSSS